MDSISQAGGHRDGEIEGMFSPGAPRVDFSFIWAGFCTCFRRICDVFWLDVTRNSGWI